MLDGFSTTVPECLASAPSINSEIRNGVTVKQTKRSIFLQVPAMTGSVHPRNLEDPLLLKTIYIAAIRCRANAPTSRSKYAPQMQQGALHRSLCKQNVLCASKADFAGLAKTDSRLRCSQQTT
uniref:Uncharacterized protein n=1 Tax=Neolamprologus brichardi TaxID=32507 RepID=A0A3Q4M2B7_NEOBR